ncbi:MAG: M20/M25/M40 family metallo-hydrolase [Anaerolineae bacterium]
MTAPNWDETRQEVTSLLQDLLRLDTTNPPGNEIIAADYIADRLQQVGIEPTVLESAPGRGNVVGRLKGTGEEAPLLLMGHVDVVPAEPAKWERPPFSGDLADGYIWGRGALDMKNTVASHLMVMLLLARAGVPLRRDVIFMANADEEVGGKMGAGWVVDNHPDLIRAEYAINEGGGMEMPIGGTSFYTVQTAEKGTARFSMRAYGRPGHASVPRPDNAVTRLCEAVAALGRTQLPLHPTATFAAMLDSIAEVMPALEPVKPALLDPATSATTLAQLPLPEDLRLMFSAMLRNTASPTILSAGTKINVIPSVAEVQVDGRTIPGSRGADLLAEARAVVGDDIELELHGDSPALEAGLESPLYDTIVEVMREHWPEARPLPLLVPGATDARHVTRLGTKVYGFSPLRSEANVDFFALIHSHNERVSVNNLLFSTQVIYDVVTRFAGA